MTHYLTFRWKCNQNGNERVRHFKECPVPISSSICSHNVNNVLKLVSSECDAVRSDYSIYFFSYLRFSFSNPFSMHIWLTHSDEKCTCHRNFQVYRKQSGENEINLLRISIKHVMQRNAVWDGWNVGHRIPLCISGFVAQNINENN